MKKARLSLPEIGLIASTRIMLGAGAGLLLADKFEDDHRNAIGWTLLAVGVITTLPLAMIVTSKTR